MHPLSKTLEAIAPCVPAELVSAGALSRLLGACWSLPGALTHGLYLECRLSADPNVDLVLNVDELGCAILSGTSPAIRLPLSLWEHPYWGEVRNLCARWGDPNSPLAAWIQRVWLEFDAVSGRGKDAAIPFPGVFLKLGAPGGAWDGAMEEVLASLPGISPPRATIRAIRQCWAALPDGAHVAYLGSFAPRGTQAVRLCVVGLPEPALPAYLHGVGWPGDTGALETHLRELAAPGGRRLHGGPGMLHLDVRADGVQPRIGLEYVLERGCQIRGTLLETEFLDNLVHLGLCTPAKRDALPAWPGYSFEELPHELWPSLVKRRVNHVKVVYEEGRPPKAKAYLCAFSEFYRRRTNHPREKTHGRAEPSMV